MTKDEDLQKLVLGNLNGAIKRGFNKFWYYCNISVILRFLRFILANERMHGDVQLGILKYSRIYIFILIPMCYVYPICSSEENRETF